jgi:hypothetical protein
MPMWGGWHRGWAGDREDALELSDAGAGLAVRDQAGSVGLGGVGVGPVMGMTAVASRQVLLGTGR